MNDPITGQFAAAIAHLAQSGVISSLCTITAPPDTSTFTASGAPDPAVPYVPVPGRSDLPCRHAPFQKGDAVGSYKEKDLEQIWTRNIRFVLLPTYYEDLVGRTDYHATLDGEEFEILAADTDSAHTQTVLAVAKSSL